jgi:hypothetical protein
LTTVIQQGARERRSARRISGAHVPAHSASAELGGKYTRAETFVSARLIARVIARLIARVIARLKPPRSLTPGGGLDGCARRWRRAV